MGVGSYLLGFVRFRGFSTLLFVATGVAARFFVGVGLFIVLWTLFLLFLVFAVAGRTFLLGIICRFFVGGCPFGLGRGPAVFDMRLVAGRTFLLGIICRFFVGGCPFGLGRGPAVFGRLVAGRTFLTEGNCCFMRFTRLFNFSTRGVYDPSLLLVAVNGRNFEVTF